MPPKNAVFVAAAVILTAAGSYFAFSPSQSGSPAFWALAGGPPVLLALFGAYWAHREDLLFEWLGPRWGDFSRGLFGAVILFGAAWAFASFAAPVGSPRELWLVSLYGQIGDPRVLQKHGGEVGAILCALALAEEIVWRGVITQMLADRVGSRSAWLWAAGLYAIAYLPTAWSLGSAAGLDPVIVIAALGGGVLWEAWRACSAASLRAFSRTPSSIGPSS